MLPRQPASAPKKPVEIRRAPEEKEAPKYGFGAISNPRLPRAAPPAPARPRAPAPASAEQPRQKGGSLVGRLLVVGMFWLAFRFIGNDPDRLERLRTYPSRFNYKTVVVDLLELFGPSSGLLIKSPQTLSFDEWVPWQEAKAWAGLLANVHPEGTSEGCVVASPSKSVPDYWYEWTRDSALVMRTVIEAYISGKAEYRDLIDEYLAATEIMQHQQTTIGGFDSGGLGEVKFHVDHTPFTGEWSRPQPDGPAARVITIAALAEHLLWHGTADEKEFVKAKLYDSKMPTNSVIKGDLEYLARHWSDPSFDLWEEVRGSHFYTLLSIQKAFRVGADLSDLLADSGAGDFYRAEAVKIEAIVPTFWSEEKQLIRVSKDQAHGRDSTENAHVGDPTYGKVSELDTATLLAALHSGEGTEWGPTNEKVLVTLGAIMDAFGPVYPLNKDRLDAPALGRYPEDQYDGTGLSLANPWHLCTLSAAETLFKASSALTRRTDPLPITKMSIHWYARFLPLEIGKQVLPKSREMITIIEGQKRLGDAFMKVVQTYAGRNGSLHEQFDRVSGEGRGARDLTWSYAAFITASQARKEATHTVNTHLPPRHVEL